MASDWIIIGALVLLAGIVVLYFKSTAFDATDTPSRDKGVPKSGTKDAVRGG